MGALTVALGLVGFALIVTGALMVRVNLMRQQSGPVGPDEAKHATRQEQVGTESR